MIVSNVSQANKTNNNMPSIKISKESNILKLFQVDKNKYEFWQKTNMPKLIETEKYFFQKANYIHENPMRKQYVTNPEYWYWSSANPQSVIKTEIVET